MREKFYPSPLPVLAALLVAVSFAILVGCSGDKDEEAAKEEGSLVRSGVAAVVGGAVSTAKEAVSGVSQGVDEGRKSGQSLDDAILVTGKEDFQRETSARGPGSRISAVGPTG